MPFLKKGTPQPIKMASTVCQICGKNEATVLVNGKMVCDECKNKMTSSKD